MLLLCGALFLAVLGLYRAPLEGALYGLLLCLAVGLCFLIVGFLQYRKKHRALERALSQLREGLPPLPEAADAIEGDYQDLLAALDEDRRAVAARAAEAQDRAETFYTAWVHQIKTPMAAMGLLLQSGEPDPALLKGELFSMEKYVDLVLTYQRLGSDTTDLVLKDCDLDTVIRAAVKEYARLFILKKLTLTFTGENGKMFGTVSGKEVAAAIEEQLGLTVDKKKISIDTVRATGEYTAKLSLFEEVKANLKVIVEEQK